MLLQLKGSDLRSRRWKWLLRFWPIPVCQSRQRWEWWTSGVTPYCKAATPSTHDNRRPTTIPGIFPNLIWLSVRGEISFCYSNQVSLNFPSQENLHWEATLYWGRGIDLYGLILIINFWSNISLNFFQSFFNKTVYFARHILNPN